MAARTKARKRALDILYEAEMRRTPVLELLAERITLASPPVSAYAAELVRGVQARRGDIDALIARYAADWTLDRMPAVDRNLLRIGAFELLYSAEVPDAVAISEAVALARELSTSSSPGFVNGLLGRLHDLKPELGLRPPEPESPSPVGGEEDLHGGVRDALQGGG
jgi:transcription antitermination protein NusB